VAIKKITRLFDDEIDAKRILREIVILKKLNHPNLVRIIEIIPPLDYKTFNSIYVVTEYCQGDLRKVFKSEHIFLELSHIRSITYQILCGYSFDYAVSSTCTAATSSTGTSSQPTSSSTRTPASRSAISA
jgi:mitogen-activated protein kinase 1/3